MIELSRILARIDAVLRRNQAYSGLLAIYREVMIASYQHCPDPASLILPADLPHERRQKSPPCLERARFAIFYANAQEEYRIDVCASCRRYLKAVDTRKAPFEAVAPVEDLATLHLDILAQKRGLIRESFNPLGMRQL